MNRCLLCHNEIKDESFLFAGDLYLCYSHVFFQESIKNRTFSFEASESAGKRQFAFLTLEEEEQQKQQILESIEMCLEQLNRARHSEAKTFFAYLLTLKRAYAIGYLKKISEKD